MSQIDCLNTNIPNTDDTLLDCNEFILSKCVIEGDKTQEEVNAEIEELKSQVQYLLLQFNSVVSTNNIVKQLNFGSITDPIEDAFNAQTSPLTINRNEIYIIKATISGTPTIYIFGRGKGTYGINGTQTSSTDFIAI